MEWGGSGEGEDGMNWQSRTDLYTLTWVQLLSHVWLWNPMNCTLQGISVHGIPHTRILEGVAMRSSSGSSQPGDRTHLSCIGRQALYHWATREAQHIYAAAAASLHLCLTLCNPRVDSPSGSSVPGIIQARILEWFAISFSNACMHAKSLQSCQTLCYPMDSSPPGSSVHRIL